MSQTKRVLMICYHFPPSPAVGGIRLVKFSKYLREHGWEPSILTVSPENHEEISATSEATIPEGIRVHRVSMWSGPRQIYLKLKGTKGKEVSAKEDTFIDQKIQSSTSAERGESFLGRIKRHVFSLMWLPDDIQGWFPPAVRAGRRIIRDEGIQALISSGPPWTPHWVGRKLSLKTGLPWLADFRDPWTRNPWKPYWVVSDFSKRVEQWMERKAVHQAARVICNTNGLRDDFRSSYPDLSPDHFTTITNGYDPDDFQQIPPSTQANQNSEMLIAYAGNLYGARNPQPLFQALRNLLDQGEESAADCRIRFIGTRVEDRIRHQAESVGVAEQVEFLPSLPHAECLQRLAEAQVLLLMQPEAHLQVPAKVFEYMQLRRPILTLAGKGATQEIVDQTGAGVVIDPSDIDGLTRALSEMLRNHRQGTLLKDQAERDYSSLHFRTLAGRLAEVLDEVSTQPQ